MARPPTAGVKAEQRARNGERITLARVAQRRRFGGGVEPAHWAVLVDGTVVDTPRTEGSARALYDALLAARAHGH